jgi:flagellar biosynthesis/type III secretory pathway M-ring protein FliF/YscJ
VVGWAKQEVVMSGAAIVGVVVVVLVVLAVVALVVKRNGERRRERDRTEAAEMRSRAAEEERVVRTHEAEAAEQEAAARQARAESDRKAAEADRLELQADERGEVASVKRDEQRDRLRAADDLDPDVTEGEPGDVEADHHGRHAGAGAGGEVREDRGAVTGHRAEPGTIPPADR